MTTAVRSSLGLPQQVALYDGTVWSLCFDDRYHSSATPWRYKRDVKNSLYRQQTRTLTDLARTVGIRRVLRNSEGHLV